MLPASRRLPPGQPGPPAYVQVRSDHTLAYRGCNFSGQVDGTPAGRFKQVASGYGHVCAISDKVYCWGHDHRQAIPPNLGGPGVIFAFEGFYPPVEAEQADPTLNTAKAGSAVPLKFSLGGDKGLDVFQAGYPASRPLDCDAVPQRNNNAFLEVFLNGNFYSV